MGFASGSVAQPGPPFLLLSDGAGGHDYLVQLVVAQEDELPRVGSRVALDAWFCELGSAGKLRY